MPAYSTHYIFAKELMSFIKDKADIEINEDAVIYGAQGPDLFFFHRVLPTMPGKSLRQIGSNLHRTKPEIIFNVMREYCESVNTSIAWSYVYGFLLHYSLDRICHPYVYAKQEELIANGKFTHAFTAHNEVEYCLDVYFLNKRYYVDKPYAFHTANTLSSDSDLLYELAAFLATVVPKITGDKLTKDDAYCALTDMKYVQQVLRDTKGFKRGFAKCLDAVAKRAAGGFQFSVMIRTKDLEKAKKYANIEKEKWQSPYEEGERFESADELFDASIEDAKKLFVAFISGEDCREITQNKSFLTGVEVI